MKVASEENEKIIKRLDEFVAKRGDSYAELTAAIGVSVGYFSRMRKFKGSIGASILAKILMYYSDLSANWLLTGHGAMLRGQVSMRDVQLYEDREKVQKEINESIAELKEKINNLNRLQEKLNKLR